MKSLLIILLSVLSNSLFAQVGRYEEPADTIPIGGQEQEDKEMFMKAEDQLLNDLVSVRDSTKYIRPQAVGESRKSEIDHIIKGLKSDKPAPELVKNGYKLLNEIRAELKSYHLNPGK